jgi:hypothetical protein
MHLKILIYIITAGRVEKAKSGYYASKVIDGSSDISSPYIEFVQTFGWTSGYAQNISNDYQFRRGDSPRNIYQTETSYIPGENRQTITIRVKQFLSKSRPV